MAVDLERLFFTVEDPLSPIRNCPALTTVMYKICNQNHERFDEACRLIRLFMEAAAKEALRDKS